MHLSLIASNVLTLSSNHSLVAVENHVIDLGVLDV